jgi:predicted ATPase
VELLRARIRKLAQKVQLLLQYAACLGSSFSIAALDLVWKEHAVISAEKSSDTVTSLLAVGLEENFIEICGDQEYRWVHDNVQEAVLSRNEAVNASFQFQIGTALYYSLNEKQLEETLFDIADLVNKGNLSKRPEFSQLNLRAAEKARSISAFHSAAKYAANGIRLLPSEKWTTHRALTLRLYTIRCPGRARFGTW